MSRITKIDEVKGSEKKIRVAAYCRVSTDADSQLLSLETQKAHYESWVKGNPEWEFAGVYFDEGLSGRKAQNRPGLMRLMADCEHGLVDFIVTKSISRFSRNTLDCLTMVRKLLQLDIPIFFEKENINTSSMESELFLSIMGSLAESESVSISENNSWGIKHRFQNGTFKCSYPPYGYDWDKANAQMVVNEVQAEVVRFIFEKTLAGMGTHAIAMELEKRNVPTKRGGKWTGHTVNGIIRNEKYTGACLFQKSYTDENMVRRTNYGEREQYYMEDHHEPIISKEDFEAANDLVDRRRDEKGITTEDEKYTRRYTLSGKVICGECGGVFKRKVYAHNKMVVLACTNHLKDKDSCSMKYVKLEDVELAFANVMNKLIFGRSRVLVPFYDKLGRTSQADSLKKINSLQEQVEKLTDKKQTIRGLFSQGIIEPAVYTQEINDATAEIDRLNVEINAISYTAGNEIKHLEETKKLLRYTEHASMLDGFDDEVFSEYVERIVIKKRTELEFEFKCGLHLTERIG